MKKIYFCLLIITLFSSTLFAQTITVSGACISGTAVLNQIADVDGKPAYETTGTVLATPNVVINIFWMPAPDNLWVLAFDGQPYFSNSCATANPPGTANPSCTWAALSGMDCTGGAALSITGAVVLPVSLTGFTAYKNGNEVVLKWATSLEVNNKGFEIQKSSDGLNWVNSGFVNGHGNSAVAINYRFTDASPYTGRNAYRLRQVDYDGNQSFSAIANVSFQNGTYYTIANNPGSGIYHLKMASSAASIEMSVMDMNGKVIYQKTTPAGDQLLDISQAAAGIYWLRIKKGSSLFTEKLIKTN